MILSNVAKIWLSRTFPSLLLILLAAPELALSTTPDYRKEIRMTSGELETLHAHVTYDFAEAINLHTLKEQEAEWANLPKVFLSLGSGHGTFFGPRPGEKIVFNVHFNVTLPADPNTILIVEVELPPGLNAPGFIINGFDVPTGLLYRNGIISFSNPELENARYVRNTSTDGRNILHVCFPNLFAYLIKHGHMPTSKPPIMQWQGQTLYQNGIAPTSNDSTGSVKGVFLAVGMLLGSGDAIAREVPLRGFAEYTHPAGCDERVQQQSARVEPPH